MAKRLNKKVAIIGSLVLALLIFAGIIVILKFSRDPQEYLKDAEAALALPEPDYKTAEKAYKQAFAYAKKDTDLKIDILFKLSDMFVAQNEWSKTAGCWNQVINIDPKNLKARLMLLDYFYQLATSGYWTAWKEVEANVSKLIEEQFDMTPRMYRIKGQALVELVKRGQMTDKEKSINDAIENLQKASQAEPNNVDVYQILADAIVQKGTILAAKGVLNAAENARQEADKILLKGVENLPNEPKAYLNLYSSKIEKAGRDQGKYKEIESDLIKLKEKFGDSPLPYFALVQIYQRDPKDIDKAIAACEKAIQLDKQNVSYALTIANLYYRRYSMNKNPQDFQKTLDMAKEALNYPDSLDIPGPRANISRMNRYALHTFLANCYLEMASNSAETQNESNWVELAEKEVYEINQILGSAENPYAVMWRGRILLAKGQREESVVQMYSAYQTLTASGQTQGDSQLGRLAYELAKVFENTPEKGAVIQFYGTALKNGIAQIKPESLLDFATALIYVQEWTATIGVIDSYENNFIKNNDSRNLRISAYLGANMLDKAQEMLDKLSDSDPNVLKLKNLLLNSKTTQAVWELSQQKAAEGQPLQQDEKYQQLKAKYEQIRSDSLKIRDKLAAIETRQISETEFMDLCRRYIADGENKKAAFLVDRYLVGYPNSVSAKTYKLVFAEPSPVNVPPERYEQIMVQVFESVKDPVQSAMALGQFYQSRGKIEQATEYYDKALQLAPDNSQAIGGLFDVAISQQNYKLAQQLVDTARKYNSDLCEGEFYKARLAFAKEEYQDAIEKISICIEKRPVLSLTYLLRSQAYSKLEKEQDAIDDAKKAYNLNPLDGSITRNLAYVLYNRNQKLGSGVTADQVTETRDALQVAIKANPQDQNLKGFYATFISPTDPARAIAISQQLQRAMPNVENSLQLGLLAMRVAGQNISQRDTYLAIAQDAYKKAYELAPNDDRVLEAYSEYLRSVGKIEEGEKILVGHDALLWHFYVRDGKLDSAKTILDKLYAANPEDVNTVRGLLLVSRNKNDQAGALKYSAELLKIDKSLDNQIIQIETYLEAGLADEAKVKLESFREKYPDEPRAIFLQAWQTARQGKLDEALQLSNRNLEIEKDNPRAWRLRGQINLALNNYNQAVDDLQKSKTLRDDPDVRIDLARVYIRTGRVEQAITELKVAADEQGSPVARNMLEQAYYADGKTDRLANFYQEIMGKFPNDIYWHNRAGEFNLANKNFDKAYQLFDAAYQNSLKVNSDSPDTQAFDGKMRTLLQFKKYDQILAESTKLLDGPLAPVAYARMADAKAAVGEKDAAVQYFRRALEKAGTNENLIIEILKEMNSVVGFDETIKWCQEKLQTQPNSIAVNFALFNLYNSNQQYNKATEYIDNCIRISTDDDKAVIVYQSNKANVLYSAFDKTKDKTYLERAIKEYESILKKQPNNVAVLNNLAYMFVDNNIDTQKALDYAEKAYNAIPNNPSVLDTYGYVLLKNGKAKQADEFFQRSLQLYEQGKINAPAEVYEHVAMVKEELGQDAEALEAYKNAMKFIGENGSKEIKARISAAIERLSKR